MAKSEYLKFKILIVFWISLVYLVSFSSANEVNYKQYDFTNPSKVFKTTLNETVTDSGIEPSVLYNLLEIGQIVIINDHPANSNIPWLTTAGILIHASPEHVYNTLKDYEHYKDFMPQVDFASSEKINDCIDRINYQLGIQILFLKVKIPYSVYHYYSPPNRVDWVMAGGKFNENLGAYEVLKVPSNPDCSMLFYTSFAEPRNAIVNKMSRSIPILDMLINLSTGTLVVRAMRDRSEETYNKKPEIPAHAVDRKQLSDLVKENPETLVTLSKRGKIIILEDSDPMTYTGGIIIDKPLQSVYQSISDVEGSSSMSDFYTMQILSKKDNSMRVKAKTVLKLIVDFKTKYIANYIMTPPTKISWVQEPCKDVEGEAGTWEFFPLEENSTLALFRHTSDLASQGILMRRLLKVEPSFEQAIHASMVQYIVHDNKSWAER